MQFAPAIPVPTDVKTDVLSLLSELTRPAKNLQDYHLRLLSHADLYLRVGATTALIVADALPPTAWDQAVDLSVHGGVARQSFNLFLRLGEYDRCRQVMAKVADARPPAPLDEMRAALAVDWRSLADWQIRQFLFGTDAANLVKAAEDLEKAGGWREAAPWSARAVALCPNDHSVAWSLLRILEDANQYDLIDQVLEVFKRGEVFPIARRILRAQVLAKQGKSRDALDLLGTIAPHTLAAPGLRERYFHDLAQVHERLGNYQEAAECLRRKNSEQVGEKADAAAFMRAVDELSRIDFEPLGPDNRADTFMMLGFPRSGTTLLENALSAHPAIESFEELPSFERPAALVLDALGISEATRRAAFEDLRRRYYAEIDRYKKKPGASVFVDKLPIRTAYIETLERVFPDKKYIFSIRHPFDVVLSCYRQLFGRNNAMENFRDFRRACALYDRVMSIWFKVFPGETDRVLYVRYDDLVLHFEREVRRALDFLGVPWNDEVLRFAEKSEARAAQTPSYAKVRSGLSIGVQSAWKNYRFLFDGKEAAPLYKWVDRFGYER
ncbi:MAG: sulfotransferase [Bauldia sp.]